VKINEFIMKFHIYLLKLNYIFFNIIDPVVCVIKVFIFITVETQQSLTAYLLQVYLNQITFKATCFGRQAAIIRPIEI
jgi:hypothetical protein